MYIAQPEQGRAHKFQPGSLLITHDIDEALLLADKICLLTPRPAKVITELTTPRFKGEEADPLVIDKLKKRIRSLLKNEAIID